jgi:hypothetical protein
VKNNSPRFAHRVSRRRALMRFPSIASQYVSQAELEALALFRKVGYLQAFSAATKDYCRPYMAMAA